MTDIVAEATSAREAGNAFFKSSEYAKANERYGAAIALLESAKAEPADAIAEAAMHDTMTKCRLNSAACLLKLQGYTAASAQASAVIKAEPGNAKAHFRLGQALAALGDLPSAQASLTEAIKLDTSVREPRDALAACAILEDFLRAARNASSAAHTNIADEGIDDDEHPS